MEQFTIFILCIFFYTVNAKDSPTVESKFGTIVGKYHSINVFGNKYTVERYFGIPYAKPPIGNLRFQKPVPSEPFKEPFKAQTHGNVCYQMAGAPLFKPGLPISEDCLFLNVYAPVTREKDLAVMIWIHGGGFVQGAADPYRADALAAHGNVIVVTINYRLTLLGFLSTEDQHAPGNYGLFDQHLAIKWVHDNIKAFGGDPNKVTIFGNSAGGASVLYQSIYDGNEGLFQRAIAESGSSTAFWASFSQARSNAQKLGNLVGCMDMSSGPLVDCLRLVPADVLFEKLNKNFEYFPIQFAPLVDGDFVKESPKQLFDSGINRPSSKGLTFFSKLDFMTGVCALEAACLLGAVIGVPDTDHFEPNRTLFEDHLIPNSFSFALGKDIPDVVHDLASHEYGNMDDPNNAEQIRNNLIQIYSDAMFNVPMCKSIAIHQSVVKDQRKSYQYRFAIKPSKGILQLPSWLKDATHADELPYLFFGETDAIIQNFPDGDDFKPEAWESDVADYMITMWSNFAKTGWV